MGGAAAGSASVGSSTIGNGNGVTLRATGAGAAGSDAGAVADGGAGAVGAADAGTAAVVGIAATSTTPATMPVGTSGGNLTPSATDPMPTKAATPSTMGAATRERRELGR